MLKNTQQLLDLMARLRRPEDGCAWDLKQDFTSLIPYLIEEAYEVVDAIERNDLDDLRSELGDLLLQVVFHSQIAEELALPPVKIHCSVLAEDAIKAAISDYQAKHSKESASKTA